MTIKKNGIKWPTPSNIISDVNDKSHGLIPWATGAVCTYIMENCEQPWLDKKESSDAYIVFPDQLKKARWYYKDISTRALDVGSAVHDAIRMYLASGVEPSDPDDQVLAAFVAFLEFFDQHKMKTIKTEERMFLNDWSGQFDWYGEFNEKLYILDWKSSKDFYREMRIQIAAYRYGWSSLGNDVEGSGCVRLDKESGLPFFKDYSKFYESDHREFLLSKELYFARHPRIAAQFKPF